MRKLYLVGVALSCMTTSAMAQERVEQKDSTIRMTVLISAAADWGPGDYVSARSNGSGWGFSSGIQYPLGEIDVLAFSDYAYLPFRTDTAAISVLQVMVGGGPRLRLGGVDLYLHALAGINHTEAIGTVLEERDWGLAVATHLGSRIHLGSRLSLDIFGNYRGIFGPIAMSLVGVNAGIACGGR